MQLGARLYVIVGSASVAISTSFSPCVSSEWPRSIRFSVNGNRLPTRSSPVVDFGVHSSNPLDIDLLGFKSLFFFLHPQFIGLMFIAKGRVDVLFKTVNMKNILYLVVMC